MAEFTLREIRPNDGPALIKLMENDPDTLNNPMSMSTHFQLDPYQAWTALKPNMAGVVAEAPGVEGLVGVATVNFDDIQFEGRVLPSAFLENLKVHHAYRGKGLGTQLAQWRVDIARQRFGDEGVILTATDTGNTASQATMKKWCTQFFTHMLVVPRPMLSKRPKSSDGLIVRPPEKDELAQIAEKSNRFYADYNLYPPLSAEKLDALINADGTFYHYRVAVDSRGNLLAGGMLSSRAELMFDEIHNIPTPLRIANRFLHLVPDDHLIRLSEVNYIWFEKLSDAQYFWNYLRWEFRDRANLLSMPLDPRTPLKDVVQMKRWHIPKIELVIAIKGPVMMRDEKWVCGTLRG